MPSPRLCARFSSLSLSAKMRAHAPLHKSGVLCHCSDWAVFEVACKFDGAVWQRWSSLCVGGTPARRGAFLVALGALIIA